MARSRLCRALAAAALAALVTTACSRPEPDPGPEVARAAATAPAWCSPDDPAIAVHPAHARGGMSCVECHAPCTTGASRVAFGPLARTGGAIPAWDPASRTCSGMYCHLAGAAPPAFVRWAFLDPDRPRTPAEACSGCHGHPPPPPHPAQTACAICHPLVVRPDGTIDAEGRRHVDGRIDAACGTCHGNPPPTGAHAAHSGESAAAGLYGSLAVLQDLFPAATPTQAPTTYAFGCGHCHPVDPVRHADGTLQIELHDPAAPPGTLKARSAPWGAWNPADGTCSGVYCHSSGQEFPAYVTSPAWVGGAKPGCAGCHQNPPAYLSGGAGAIDANSHLGLADDGYEFGHFLGLPGPWHTTKHGFPGAAPITCQACHHDTVDPANVAPGGFYWLDTTGSYRLPGGDPGRIASGWSLILDCASCHTGDPDDPPQGTGRVLPLRHVNGVRDVVFDPRTSLPAIAGLPAPPNTPPRPYWVAKASRVPWPATTTRTGTTISFDLGAVVYDRATKTCSGAACHLLALPTWGRPYGWGPRGENCNLCHPY